jgi:hypothetical protein
MIDFCINTTKRTIEKRENENIVRKDLMQYLIQIRNNASIDEWKIGSTSEFLTQTCLKKKDNCYQFNIFQIRKNRNH